MPRARLTRTRERIEPVLWTHALDSPLATHMYVQRTAATSNLRAVALKMLPRHHTSMVWSSEPQWEQPGCLLRTQDVGERTHAACFDCVQQHRPVVVPGWQKIQLWIDQTAFYTRNVQLQFGWTFRLCR